MQPPDLNSLNFTPLLQENMEMIFQSMPFTINQ